jgi:cell division protein ZapA (FtsZ GTPase activity inhibitor)
MARLISLLFLFGILSCGSKKQDPFLNYLDDLKVNNSEFGEIHIFYMINLNACSDCVELNLNYLKANHSQLNLNLIIVGYSSQYQDQIENIDYNVIYDRNNLASRYGLYNQKPLLVVLKKGEVCKKMNIHDEQVSILATFLTCEESNS